MIPPELREKLEELNRLIPKRAEYIRTEKRKLALMEAGLEARPLDRDFYELCKLKFEREESEFEMITTIKKVCEERNSNDQ